MLPFRCRQQRQFGMQKEVISGMPHHNSSTHSADYNTTEVSTINCAKGFAQLHSDPCEAWMGGGVGEREREMWVAGWWQTLHLLQEGREVHAAAVSHAGFARPSGDKVELWEVKIRKILNDTKTNFLFENQRTGFPFQRPKISALQGNVWRLLRERNLS